MTPAGRPPLDGEARRPVTVRLSPSDLSRLDDYVRSCFPHPSRNEALVRLLRRALAEAEGTYVDDLTADGAPFGAACDAARADATEG